MALSLHTIKKPKANSKKRKRIGRGNASGHGTYAGKGQKGQNARSGVSGLKRKGIKQVLLRTPKKRGFTSSKPKAQVVKVQDINANFKDNDVINSKVLLEKKLIKSVKLPIKILGSEKLSIKVKFDKIKMSKSVLEQITKKQK